MGKENKQMSKLTLVALILMIFTSVFGFNNIPRAFYLGILAILWYLFGAIAFFIPYAFMMAEYGAAFKEEKGIYAWWREQWEQNLLSLERSCGLLIHSMDGKCIFINLGSTF